MGLNRSFHNFPCPLSERLHAKGQILCCASWEEQSRQGELQGSFITPWYLPDPRLLQRRAGDLCSKLEQPSAFKASLHGCLMAVLQPRRDGAQSSLIVPPFGAPLSYVTPALGEFPNMLQWGAESGLKELAPSVGWPRE